MVMVMVILATYVRTCGVTPMGSLFVLSCILLTVSIQNFSLRQSDNLHVFRPLQKFVLAQAALVWWPTKICAGPGWWPTKICAGHRDNKNYAGYRDGEQNPLLLLRSEQHSSIAA